SPRGTPAGVWCGTSSGSGRAAPGSRSARTCSVLTRSGCSCRRLLDLESGQSQHPVPALGGERRVLEVSGLRGELDGAREVRKAGGGGHAAHHRERALVAVQPGQERDPGLVVVGGGGEDVPSQLLGGIQDAARLAHVPAVQRLHGGGGGGGSGGEGAQQR